MHSSRMRTVRSSGRGVCLGACWDTPLPRLGLDPPQAWAWRPLSGQTSQPPPPVWAWRPPPDPPTSPMGMGLETSPVDRMTDTCKNITFPTSFVDGNKSNCARRYFSRKPTAHFPASPEERGLSMARSK